MYVALSQFLYLWELEEQRGRGLKVIISREGDQATYKTPQKVNPSTSLSESVFLLWIFFYIIGFFVNLQMTTE